jgi:hypothetical protein
VTAVDLKQLIYATDEVSTNKKRQLARPWHRWEDNIRMDLTEMGWECVDCMHLAQDTDQWRVFVNTVMNLRVP